MGKSMKDFINKPRIVLEEADESAFWIEFINDLGIYANEGELKALHKEAVELTKILTASIRTAERMNIHDFPM